MDVVTMARTAREGFARGLGALQTPGVPPDLMAAAEPIAQAMSALHHIENTRGVGGAEAGAMALNAARQALAKLQSGVGGHPAAQQAVEAVAGSLGLVHQISQAVMQGSVAPVPPTQPSGVYAGGVEPPPQVAVVQPGGYPAPQHQRPVNPVAQTQLAPNQGYGQHGATQPSYPHAAYGQGAPQQPPPAWPAAPPPAAAPAGGGSLRVDAELGAHSPTNFYKGLSGNDVVDSGGIFVATYNIPEIGTPLLVKVSLPGGYEFEAQAVVRWTRDAPLSGADSPPGFGAQFTQITPEARQLIYRYVRNREPLFHDDL